LDKKAKKFNINFISLPFPLSSIISRDYVFFFFALVWSNISFFSRPINVKKWFLGLYVWLG